MLGRMPESEAAAAGQLVMILQGGALLSLCVVIHSLSLVALGRRLLRTHTSGGAKFSADLLRLIGVTAAIVLVHVFEIGCWASLYVWKGFLSDFPTAFYFSSVTYTTVGYGDVVLPAGARGFSGAEALTGILLTGLSTGFLFAVLNRMFSAQLRAPSADT